MRWLWLSLVALGCTETKAATDAPTDEPLGEIGLNLDTGGLHLDAASYVIHGPHELVKTGDIDVEHSSKLTVTIGGLPAGAGYSLELTASALNPNASCAGSARFDVAPGVTTDVALRVNCRVEKQRGSVEVGGSLNICSQLDGISASPSEVTVGGTITLTAVAHDTDAAPEPLHYGWASSRGTLETHDSTAAWRCVEPGPATISLTVTDGDPACTDSDSVDVTCTAAPGQPEPSRPTAAPVPRSFAGLLGMALLALGLSRARKRQLSR